MNEIETEKSINSIKDKYNSLTSFKKEIRHNNVFSIFNIEVNEIRHSNYLKYLLDSSVNGCIRTKFINEFIDVVISDKRNNTIIKKAIKEGEYEVARESDHIDILIDIKGKCMIGIENKILASERENQLTDYWGVIKKNSISKKYVLSPILVFLTQEGREPVSADKDVDHVEVSYHTIKRIVKNIHLPAKRGKFLELNRLLLEDYKEVLSKKVAKNSEELAFYKKCINDKDKELQKAMTAIAKYSKNIAVRKFVIDEYMKKKNDIKPKGDSVNYIYYYPNNWVIPKYNIKGRITVLNREGNSLRIGIYLSWDDPDNKEIGYIIKKWFKQNSSNYSLAATSSSVGDNNNGCSCGYKPYVLIDDNNTDKFIEESERLRKMIIRLDEFFDENGEYARICKFFEDCKNIEWDSVKLEMTE